MRTLILAGLLALHGLAAADPARAEVWCLRAPGTESQTLSQACAFASAQDCARAASFGAFGGVCERQALRPGATPDRRRTGRQSPQERQGRDQWRW